jgi:hypothetical protein
MEPVLKKIVLTRKKEWYQDLILVLLPVGQLAIVDVEKQKRELIVEEKTSGGCQSRGNMLWWDLGLWP